MTDSVERLYEAVRAAKNADPLVSRTARLLRAGRGKMAKKLAEEAVEVVIDAMSGHTDAVIRESADLIYNLVVLWVSSGIHPDDVWREMSRREELLGIAEKMPKNFGSKNFTGTAKSPAIKSPAVKGTGIRSPAAKAAIPKTLAGKPLGEVPARRKVMALARPRLRKRR
jgi:phosphoribosyl-ATP pyrophosphohydrolase